MESLSVVKMVVQMDDELAALTVVHLAAPMVGRMVDVKVALTVVHLAVSKVVPKEAS